MGGLSDTLKRAFLKDPDGVVLLKGTSPRELFVEIKQALDAGLVEDLGDVGAEQSPDEAAIAYRLTPAGRRAISN